MQIRTRMAPSPTGEVHVGTLATLLKNYAFAKQHDGAFILRIEDTDQTREVEGATDRILSVIADYGLTWDEGPDIGGPFAPYTQSERLPIYQEHAELLLSKGLAYRCFCTRERLEAVREQQMHDHQQPRYDGTCRALSDDEVAVRVAAGEQSVIRLKVPHDTEITFTDLIRGDISFSGKDVDDQVLLKTDGFPTYHLAVVVDDHLMQITHILRGEEWISSTPKHILLYQAFGWELPVFAHIPVFLNPDGKGKMSKRKGMVSARSFLDRGYLPEAMLNFFMVLGWARDDQREIMTLEEYVKEFDPAAISSKSVVFDLKKLQWFNGIYIRQLPEDELLTRLTPFLPEDRRVEQIRPVLPLIRERLVVLSDIGPLTDYFFNAITVDADTLIKNQSSELVLAQLPATKEVLSSLDSWTVNTLEEALRKLQLDSGWQPKQYFMMLRLVLTGQTATPPLFDTIMVLGKERTLSRIEAAAASLSSH